MITGNLKCGQNQSVLQGTMAVEVNAGGMLISKRRLVSLYFQAMYHGHQAEKGHGSLCYSMYNVDTAAIRSRVLRVPPQLSSPFKGLTCQ